jgi:hypothetical protein
MAQSTDVRLSLGWPPKPTVTTHLHGPSNDPRLAGIIYLEIHSGVYDRICISGTARQLRELLVELAAAVRAAVPGARQAAANAQPEPEPAVQASYLRAGQRVWTLRRLSCGNAKLASLHLIAPVMTTATLLRPRPTVPSRGRRLPGEVPP